MENGKGMGHNSPPVNYARMLELARSYADLERKIKNDRKDLADLKEEIGSMFPDEAGEQFHYFREEGLKVVFKQSEIRKFNSAILKELYPMDSDHPECLSVGWDVDKKEFDQLPDTDETKINLKKALTRSTGLRKITLEYDNER